MRIIYKPRGRAREYAPLAVSLYRGCPHGCVYCFAPESTNMKREKFLQVHPRKDALRKLELDCKELAAANDQREILMSFTCDPYPPAEEWYWLTRQAIRIFHHYNLHYSILTKAGERSTEDFDLMASRPDLCRYGTSLTIYNSRESKAFERNAALPYQRILALSAAKLKGIPTWVSMEPVIYPSQTLELIQQTLGDVDEYRIGKFNHTDDPELQQFIESIGYIYPTDQDWREFVQAAKALLDEHGCRYIFKKDLQPYLQPDHRWRNAAESTVLSEVDRDA